MEEEALFLDWVADYLRPTPLGGQGFRAHQFTINGLTYPFVRDHNFAAVPDIPRQRRYDMFAGLHLVRPGDLLFFYQADPQHPSGREDGNLAARRGICGIYRAASTPFRATGATDAATGYRLLDRCPGCETFQATLAKECWSCGQAYPPTQLMVKGKPAPALVISSRMRTERLVPFDLPVSDERAYADLSDPGLVWMGRHDNGMGPGKGSSIRQLLPEEAVKLARLLAREPGQSLGAPSPDEHPMGPPLLHPNGLPIDLVPTEATGEVELEDELYYILARQVGDPASPFSRLVAGNLPAGLAWHDLEYAWTIFPWGYTGGSTDLVLLFRGPAGRMFVVVVECKPGSAHDEAVLQSLLYVERTLQVLFLHPGVAPPGRVEVLPMVVAKGIRRIREGQPRVAIPRPYTLPRREYWGGGAVEAAVRSPLFLSYDPPEARQPGGPRFRDATRFGFSPAPPERTAPITWAPHPSSVRTEAEVAHILRTTWADARRAAGI